MWASLASAPSGRSRRAASIAACRQTCSPYESRRFPYERGVACSEEMARAAPHAMMAHVVMAHVVMARAMRVHAKGRVLATAGMAHAKGHGLVIAAVIVVKGHGLVIAAVIVAVGALAAVGATSGGARSAHSASIMCSRSTIKMSRACTAIYLIAVRSSRVARLARARAISDDWASPSRTRDIWRCCRIRRRSGVASERMPERMPDKMGESGRPVTGQALPRTK
jgi:hypothetical protein